MRGLGKKSHGEGTDKQTHRHKDIATTRKNRPKGRFFENKPAAQAAGADPSDTTAPIGKTHPFSKIALAFEPIGPF